MRVSEFWRLMDDEFDASYSRVLSRDLVLRGVGGLTANEALKKGVEPKKIWQAVCEVQDVPASRRLGRDIAPKS